MNGWLALVAIVAALNPLAAAVGIRSRVPALTLFGGAALAALAYGGIASFTFDILDALAVEPATFEIAAGAVVAASSVSLLVLGPRTFEPAPLHWGTAVAPVALPLLLNPACTAVVMVVAERESSALAAGLAAAVVAAAAALVWTGTGRAAALADGSSRFLAALSLVIGASFAVDGVRSI